MRSGVRTQLPPEVMTLLGSIRSADAQAVAQAQGYALAQAQPAHVWTWPDDDAPPLDGSTAVRLDYRVPDWALVLRIAVGVRAAPLALNSIDYSLGGYSGALAVGTDHWSQGGVLVSDTGTGWITLTLGGTSDDAAALIREVAIRPDPLADADLPGPT